MEGVTIREATVGDYEAILAIRTVYGGRDYLKDNFMYIIKGNKGYVAVLGDQIIGFKFACIIDNGMTLLTRAARVKEEHEGKGVNRMLNQHIISIYRNSVKYKAVAFHDKNTNLMRKMHDGLLNIPLFNKRLGYIAAARDLRQNGPPMNASNTVKNLTPDDVGLIFSSEKLCKQLFPSNRLVASFSIPLRIMKENIVHIFGENGVALGTNVMEGDEHTKTPLTVGHTFTCPLGQIYLMNLYGDGLDCMIDHMIIHILYNELVSATKEEFIIFEVHTDRNLELLVENGMMKLGYRQHKWDTVSTIYCTEYELSK